MQGAERVRLRPAAQLDAYLEAEYERLPDLKMEDAGEDAAHVDALLSENLELSKRIAHLYGGDNGDQMFQQLVGSIKDPITQMYRIANLVSIPLEQEQAVLECETVRALMEHVHEILPPRTQGDRTATPDRPASPRGHRRTAARAPAAPAEAGH